MKKIRLTCSQALVQFLDKQYIEYDGKQQKFVEGMVGIFGHGSVLGIGDALQLDNHSLRFYRANNEQGAGHIAMGFAKQHNRKKILCAFSSIGPGAMNMITAAATATANRIPVLFIPGDIFATRQPDPVLQQIEQEHDYTISSNDAFRPVSKYWDRISRPEQIMSAAIHAMRVLTDPATTGAVTLSLPQDTAAEAYDYPLSFFKKRIHRIQRRPLAPELAEEIATKIAKKKKPLIIVGGGVRYSEAWKEVEAFAQKYAIPFAETQAGKGVILSHTPLNLGGVGTTGTECANKYAATTDCLIAIGTRLNDFHTASKWAFRNTTLEVLSINVNSMDAYKLNGTPYIADAKLAIQEIDLALQQKNYSTTPTVQQTVSTLKAKWDKEVDSLYAKKNTELLTQTQILGELNEGTIVPDSAIIVCASGSLPSDLERVWRTKSLHSYHLEYGYSCMGYEIAGAIGAKIAEPKRDVYALVGDGAYLMLHQEIVMAIEENIKITIILVDNGGWQCIDNLQTGSGIPRFGCELRFRNPTTKRLDGDYVPIDFAQNAQSYGADTWTVCNETELQQALTASQKSKKLCLIACKSVVKSMTQGYATWWRAGTPEVSNYPAVKKATHTMHKHIQEAKEF